MRIIRTLLCTCALPNYIFHISGISAMTRSVTGRQLPNARELSNRLFIDKNLVDPVWNLNAQQWGQIITHDMSLTAGAPPQPGK